MTFLQMSALESCLYFVCRLLRKESSTLQLKELILVLFVVRKNEFLGDDLGVNQNVKNRLQKTFSCNPDVSHVLRGMRLSRLSGTRTWKHCTLTGNLRQSPTVI